MPFRFRVSARSRSWVPCNPRSWRVASVHRTVVVAALALLVMIAPRAAELCNTICAMAQPHAAVVAPASPAASGSGHGPSGSSSSQMESGHCAAHEMTRPALHAAHACGMPAHALPVQVIADAATTGSPRMNIAPISQPWSMATRAAAFSPAIAPPPHVPLGLAHLAAQSARLRPLTLALRL
jgi:hypothetical protein